jgi:hypothetical protein
MITTLNEALANLKLYTDNIEYSIIKLTPRAITTVAGIVAEIGEPFIALIVDNNEITLVIPSEALEAFAKRIPGYLISQNTYKLITLDIELDLMMVGFMAYVSKALAEAGIAIFPLAAYSRDHILVLAEHCEKAMTILESLRYKKE